MAYQTPALPSDGIVQSSEDILRMVAEDDGAGGLQLKTGAVIETGDIEIGAVELKNASSDDRANISDANTARAATDHVLLVQVIDDEGHVLHDKHIATATFGALSANGSTSTIDNRVTGYREGSWGYVTTGTPATCTVTMEVSMDNVTWYALGTAQTNTTGAAVSFSEAMFPRLRWTLSNLTGGTAPTVIITYHLRT